MVLEVFVLGFVVFIVAPLLFVSILISLNDGVVLSTSGSQLFWNIILLCLGRHPMQNPHMIKPEIGKLPKSIVDRIPLVVYIPPPPDEITGAPKIPEAIYTYPPNRKTSTTPPKRRFAFLRKTKAKKANNDTCKDDSGNNDEKSAKKANGEPQSWEEHWEQGEYPFVRLEGNRAACAICLMDFEEPKRVAGLPTIGKHDGEKSIAHVQPVEGPMQDDRIREEGRDTDLKLEDAGEGAQPLRLLACGHVFHVSALYLVCMTRLICIQKICLDPWLVDVSGRCPVCQRPVELPEPGRKKKRGRQEET
jgi:hypothetical protein